jgi:hypothetical protein
MTGRRFQRGLTMADIGLSPPKASKFKNTSVEVDGLKFASKAEAARYGELRLLERAGQIQNLKTQVRFELLPAIRYLGAKRQTPALDYVADFTYEELVRVATNHGRGPLVLEWLRVIEDCKGARTRVYLMKKHMMKALLGHDIRETRAR